MTISDTARLDAVLRAADAGLAASGDRLFDYLRIASVSAQPQHAPDCLRAAEWMRDTLTGLGFAASVRPTAGHPVVLAHLDGPADYGGPHILFYGHYDVQPADPLDLWTSPPFEPHLVDGPRGPRFVARGAVDNKGQTMMFIEAMRAWHSAGGGIPARITVLLEGEEEIGSVNLGPWLDEARAELKADFALISDTNMWDVDTPAITTRLRGMLYVQVDLRGPSRDLHSGLFGGSALNPINALTRVLAGLKDDTGRITLPGFYDEVLEVSVEDAATWDALGFDEGAFLGKIGLSHPAGEADRPALQRMWARPTMDINGIWGGYAGPGAKTVIPAEASAKVSFRLVPDQNPERVLTMLKTYLAANLPPDATCDVQVFGSFLGLAIDVERPWVDAAVEALTTEYGHRPVMMGGGGSIPVVEMFRTRLGLDSLLMGFGLSDDQVHSPNEKFEQRCFHHGIRAHARLLARLAGITQA